MYYRIAEVTLRSQISLPSFNAFICEKAKPDVTLETAEEVPPAGGGEIICGRIAVRKVADGWFFHAKENDRFGMLVSDDYKRLRLLQQEKRSITFNEMWYIRIALECLLIHRGYVSLHAACVDLDGEAFAFSGPSGIGKSTRANVWINTFGAELISGDRPMIRTDRPEAFGVPWDGKEHCFRNAHFPLSVICDVRRSDSVYVRKMTFAQKRRLLMQQCFLPMWDTDTAAIQIMNIVRLASRAKIVRVFCGPREDDMKALRQALEFRQECKEAAGLKAKSGFILRDIAGEHILMPIDDNISKYNGVVLLNDVSAFLWKKLEHPVSRDDLLTALLDQYRVDEATAANDLDQLLEKLRSFDVIEDESSDCVAGDLPVE